MKQKGFTLIELIVVIVILGILSATALPKFIDLSGDARSAALDGIGGSAKAAALMVYGKAAANGKDLTAASGQSISVGTTTINLVYGYPAATCTNGIGDVMQDTGGATCGGSAVFTLKTGCTITYNAATSTSAPPTTTKATGSC